MNRYLRLEQAVEVPEAALDPAVGRHLLEAHIHEDLAELGSHLRRRVVFFGFSLSYSARACACARDDVRQEKDETNEV